MSDFRENLEELKSLGLYRSLRDSVARGSRILAGGEPRLNLASNDYLGISGDVALQRKFLSSLADFPEFVMGGVSSRLLGGNNPAFSDLETFIGGLFGAVSGRPRACLLFNGGYHANTGILPALAGERDLILADKLVHASLIDALKLCGAKWMRFPHNDCARLREILSRERKNFERVFIVTESVFSMDGDCADLVELAAIKREFGAMLYVDEAHAFGVFGKNGLGLCEELGIAGEVDFIMCTLGKAAGSAGAFAVCDADVRELLVNRCRPFIFTTALPPITALWTKFAISFFPEFAQRRERLIAMSRKFREMLAFAPTLGDTQIVPLVLGENARALEVSEKLWELGIWAPAVRHPTVPKGSARLRMSLNAAITDFELADCAEKLEKILTK